MYQNLKRIIWLKQTPRAHDYGLIPLYLCPPREDDEIRRRVPAYIVEKKTIPRATKKSKRKQNRIKPRTFLFWSVKYWPKRLSLSSNFPGLRRIFPRKPSRKKNAWFLLHDPVRAGSDWRRSCWVYEEREHSFFGWRCGHWIGAHSCWVSQPWRFQEEEELVPRFRHWDWYAFFFSLSFFGFGFFMLLQVLCFLFVKKMKLFLLMGVRCNSCSKILEGRFREKFWSNVLFRIVLLGNWKVFVS